jgi:hypothetical protein
LWLRRKQNQKLIFSFKFPFNLVADPASRRGAGEAETLTYPKWWTILKLARTIFSPPAGGEKENPQKI